MGIGASVVLLAIGAVLAFAVSADVSGVSIDTVGVILMVAGLIGLVCSLVLTARHRSADSEVVEHRPAR